MANFGEVERLFDQVLSAASGVLSRSQLEEVRSFIEVREYGIALETLVGIFLEEKKKAPEEVIALVRQLAASMSMEEAPLVKPLFKST